MKYKIKNIIALSSVLLITQNISASGFTIDSNDLKGQISNNQVFNGFGCNGKNISPQISWSNIPKGTKSFAITMYDKDAPTGSGWWHWVVVNINKDVTSIKSGASKSDMPKNSIQSKTDFNTNNFGGACPPKGSKAHEYMTTVYALDVERLPINTNSNPALAGYMINSHTIEKSSIVNYYKR